MAKLKRRSLLALLGVSVVCMGSLLPTDTFIAPCQAMQAATTTIDIDVNDFMGYVNQNVPGKAQLDTVLGQKQLLVIDNLFQKFNNKLTDQNKNTFFGFIDQLAQGRQILGKQAGVLKQYIDLKFSQPATPTVNLDVNDFMGYVNQNVPGKAQLDTVLGQKQLLVIDSLFQKFNNKLTDQDKNTFFGAIDQLAQSRQILGKQAGALKGYIDYKLGIPVAVLAPALPNQLLQWTKTVANTVNAYFKLPYTDSPFLDSTPGRDKIDCSKYGGGFLHRPNHGLTHGVRQGLYAVDIVEGLNGGNYTFAKQKGQDLQAWVRQQMISDPNFLKKVEFASAFQRSGRKSEADGTGGKNPLKDKAYMDYMQIDEDNFRKDAAAYAVPGGMFEHDLDIYADALSPNGPNSQEAQYLESIFVLAHRLDLRRLTYSRPTGSFQENMCDEILDSDYSGDDKHFIDTLWGRAGEYLRATDRDRDPSVKTHMQRNPAVVCDLGRNPDKLAQTLVGVRDNTNYHFK